MLGEVDEALSQLETDSSGDGDITELEFVNFMANDLIKQGYKLHEVENLNLLWHIELLCYNQKNQLEKNKNNLLI